MLLQLKPGISTQALLKVLKIKASTCKEYHCMLILNISQSIYTHMHIKYLNQIFKSSSMVRQMTILTEFGNLHISLK